MKSLDLYRRLLAYVKPYSGKIIFAMISMVGFAASTSLMAVLVQPIIDGMVGKDVEQLKILPLQLLGIFLARGFFDYWQEYLIRYAGQQAVADMRQSLYDHIQSLSLSFFTRTPTGVLISRIMNDVNLVQGAVSSAITSMLKHPLTIVGLAGVAFYRDWRLASVAFLILPVALIPIYRFSRKIRRVSIRGQQMMARLTNLIHETTTGVRIVKAFNMEDYEKDRFRHENAGYLRQIMKRIRVRALSSPVMEVIGGIVVCFIVFLGSYYVARGYSLGKLASFLSALLLIYRPMKSLVQTNNLVQEGLAAGTRIFELLDERPDASDAEGARPLAKVERSIEFRKVSFMYDEDWVLRDINLKVEVGEVIALVGSSGGGKTTLVNLIPRFYDVTEGEILIDGTDVRAYTLKSLRDRIGIVTQQTILFNDTAKRNIAYGSFHKSDEEILEAAKAASAHDFIERLPNGYDTVIGEQGVRLSGGERQRIAIARAILKNAPILILDEATSSLDSESELEVQKALERLMAHRTVFVIAHRLSTIRKADRILVIQGGRIVEEGDHRKLMAMGGEYRRLYRIQFRDMETIVEAPSAPGVA
ncbi:MAG: lipid A export permease/ATP-binding protein MsbA [Deltaproteobacteria bacterium]|nr:lipid A export permease/ATP-binding protein MsbA [Deltaproteobacteria bacterium]MBW2120975.1 lipid A export permease/ATP-binding protein MsbA [Deltaproteobacteria bacterium]